MVGDLLYTLILRSLRISNSFLKTLEETEGVARVEPGLVLEEVFVLVC